MTPSALKPGTVRRRGVVAAGAGAHNFDKRGSVGSSEGRSGGSSSIASSGKGLPAWATQGQTKCSSDVSDVAGSYRSDTWCVLLGTLTWLSHSMLSH
jgi:hypothetical protein